MRRAIATRVAVPLFAIWMAASAILQAAPELRSIRNTHFEVIGFDLRSVSYVNELSQVSLRISERYLDRGKMAFPAPILISLRPEEHVDFEGDYRIRLAARGAVQLDLRWEDDLTLELSCRAITEALLVQYAIFNYGLEGPRNLRSWSVAALGEEVYYSLRSAEFIDLLERTRGSEIPSLTAIVESMQARPTVAPKAGYWLLQAMKRSLDRSVIRSLFEQAVAGIDIEEALTVAVDASDPRAEPVEGQGWWNRELSALLSQNFDVIDTMDTSRAWLATLAGFDAPLVLESGETELNLRSLWTHRSEPELRALVEARYEILRLRMARANPAYYNAARSLGVLFEAILNDAPSYKYIHSLTLYLSDWEDAKEMQAEVENILNKK